MEEDKRIQEILLASYEKKLKKQTLCACGNTKGHLYKMCCRCNNRNKKNVKNGLKTKS